MDGFLSLPRFAKGGLAVLLAVALLGWAIVAYSAKRQHEDAKSLENALATLKSQGEREDQTLAEVAGLEQRIAAADAELASSRQALAASREEKSALEAKLAELEADLSDVVDDAADRTAPGDAQALFDSGAKREGVESEAAAGLRARLTEAMTALSARSATLQQRERELSRARAGVEAATAEIETLERAATERDTLRERLTGAMTTLSARGATVEQRERELARVQAEHEKALAEIETMEAVSADQEEAGRSLDAIAVKLDHMNQALSDGAGRLESNRQAIADQDARLSALEQERTALQEAIETRKSELAELERSLDELRGERGEAEARLDETRMAIETATAELADVKTARADGDALSSSLAAEIDAHRSDLVEKEDAIAEAETELARLKGEISSAEARLETQDGKIQRNLAAIERSRVEAQDVEAALAGLKAEKELAETETTELQNAIERQSAALKDLADIKEAQGAEADAARPLPKVTIASLDEGGIDALPIDPLQTPFPVQTPGGVRLALVHFDLGSAELTPGGLRRAKEAAAWIKERGVGKIKLVGATDTIGTEEDNLVLATSRARTLLEAFAAEGIDPDRIELVSLGEAGGGEVIGDQTAEPLNRCVGVFIEPEG